MRNYCLFLALCLISIETIAQKSMNDVPYRSKENALYWKNRKPDAAYWQQDVHYKIDAKIDEEQHKIEGKQTLFYYNNSPDTLNYVYFHLWQNAFVKGSYLHKLERSQHVKPRLGEYEEQGLGCVIEQLEVDGKNVEIELDNTILKVYLPEPLYPNHKTTFSIDFTTYWDKGATRRRMKMYDAWGQMHYNGVQWFPKMCVYDRKFGWDTYQHLNKEFYADFGSYDVSLNFPSNYVVEATGALLNREEVLPKDLREQLDVKNFKDKKWNEPPSIITPYVKGQRKTWKFRANNVHDFAFTADPSYRLDTEYWNGIECVGIVQEPHARGWQQSADYVAKIIKTFSEDIGMYQYPKMVAADAADGMEYPMITLDGGSYPGFKGLFVHEIGHNWFYGMVGNNETYRASLDEGFTQFLTAWGLTKLEGDLVRKEPKKLSQKSVYNATTYRDLRVYNRYISTALNGNEKPLNTHSNDFNDALHHEGGYGMVYYKTATMLYSLQYVLGDTLFQNALRHYFHQWRFAHPYFNDFRRSIINYTHVDLNWFFDQWLETTKRLDYGITGIKRLKGNDSFSVTFKRNGEMQMPIDFTVFAKDGSVHNFHIPNTWFEKEFDGKILNKWYGWGSWNKTYDAHIQVPSGIKNVQIDTSYRLADIYAVDNYKTKGLPLSPKAVIVKPDFGYRKPSDHKHHRGYIRPDLWWNPIDGIKAGVTINANYLNTMHKLHASVWFNTHVGQYDTFKVYDYENWYNRHVPVNYNIAYESPFSRFTPKFKLQVNSKLLDGLWYHRGGVQWEKDKHNTLRVYAQTMWRNVNYDRDYLIYNNEWSSMKARPNSSINISWTHTAKYTGGRGIYNITARAPFFTGNSANDFNYSFLQLTAQDYYKVHKLDIKTRLFARYGTGSVIPYESALWLAGANPEQLMDNKYTRSQGFVPDDWRTINQTETNHFHMGGGLNLRGYAGYLIAEQRNGQLLIGYKGRSGVSTNVEIEFDNYIKLKPKFTRKWLHLDAYLFADAGIIELSQVPNLNNYWNIIPTTMWSSVRLDAGLGVAATIKKWWRFSEAHPLTIRFDVPAWVNRPPNANPDYFKFRYVIGINRAF